MPKFTSEDIEELLKYAEDLTVIPSFPLAPVSYSAGGKLRLGECILWTVETIRLGNNASMGCKMVHTDAENYEGIYFLSDEEVLDAEKNDVRTVLRLHPALAPFKCAVLPLSKKLGDKGREIQAELSKYFMVDYDDAGSIGKRYRREDEIGTPYCITVDFQTVGDDKTPADNAVTIRNRDTMEQVRVPISELKSWLEEKLTY